MSLDGLLAETSRRLAEGATLAELSREGRDRDALLVAIGLPVARAVIDASRLCPSDHHADGLAREMVASLASAWGLR